MLRMRMTVKNDLAHDATPMTKPVSRPSGGFTLIEVLVSFMILTIGFSALYYWFIGSAQMTKRDRIRTEALEILRSEAELRNAYPEFTQDSQWTVLRGNDTFALQSLVRDSISDPIEHRVMERPREVTLKLSGDHFTTSLFFVVGGLEHAAP